MGTNRRSTRSRRRPTRRAPQRKLRTVLWGRAGTPVDDEMLEEGSTAARGVAR